jgi:hypothetical protein
MSQLAKGLHCNFSRIDISKLFKNFIAFTTPFNICSCFQLIFPYWLRKEDSDFTSSE